MPFGKRNRAVYLTILTVLALTLGLPGCKEGTDSAPVSSMITGINSSHYTTLPASEKKYTVSGDILLTSGTPPTKSVTVDLYYNDVIAKQKLSTSNGKFYFNELPPAQYVIVAAMNDQTYATSTQVIELLTDGTTQPASISITLYPKK